MATVVKTMKDLEALVRGILGESVKALRDEMAHERATDRAALAEMRAALDDTPTTAYAAQFAGPRSRGERRGLTGGKLAKGELTNQFFWAVGKAMQAERGWGEKPSPSKCAAEMFGADALIVRVLSATEGSGTSVIPSPVADEIIEFLREDSVFRAFGPPFMDLSSGRLTIPKMTAGSSASYVSENAPAPITEQEFGDVQMFARIMRAQMIWSNDWIKRQVSGASAMSQSDIVAAFAERSDLAFIRGTGASNTPIGVRWLAHTDNVMAAQATPTLEKVTEDISRLKLALRRKIKRFRRPGFMWNPQVTSFLENLRINSDSGIYAFRDEMVSRGTLLNIPFKDTMQIPDDLELIAGGGGADHTEIYLVDFANIVVGETEAIELDMSNTASYETGDPAFPIKSAYSRNQTVIRALTEHDLCARHNGTIAVLTDCEWGQGL